MYEFEILPAIELGEGEPDGPLAGSGLVRLELALERLDQLGAAPLGGYAFCLDGTYAFGADRPFRQCRIWEGAFDRLLGGADRVAVDYGGQSYVLLASGDRTTLRDEGSGLMFSLQTAAFRAQMAEARAQVDRFREAAGMTDG